jgi:hypothetical protein
MTSTQKKSLKLLTALVLLSGTMPAFAMHYLAPLNIDKAYVKAHGNTITGNFQGTQTAPAILVSNATGPIYIVNSNVQGPGDLIKVVNSDVHVMNTTGVGTYPTQTGIAKGTFVTATNPVNLVVSDCHVSDVSFGVYVTGYGGNNSINNAISILRNHFSNIDGRPTDGKGGYVTSGDFKAHAVQINNVLNVPGIEIAWNEIINTPHISASGQLIEIIDGSGIPSNHMLIHDNYIQGAYPANPGVDGYTGGGMIVNGTATDTAATTSAYIDIYNNQIVSTANVGIAVAAGHDISVHDNRIVSSGYLSDGTFMPMSYANGIYNWNYYNQGPKVFFNDDMNTNTVGMIAKDSNGNPRRSDWYLPGQKDPEANVDLTPNDSAHPTLADEANEYTLWQNKVNNQTSSS